MYPTTIQLSSLENGFEAFCEVLHPMDSGESDPSAANYITQLVFRLNGSIHAEFFLGKYVSRQPTIGTVFADAVAGDIIDASWQDIAGNAGQASVTVK